MTTNLTLQIMENEAELYASFNRLQKLLGNYLDVYPMVQFNPENAKGVADFIEGMDALKESFIVLLEALKLHADIHGVQIITPDDV